MNNTFNITRFGLLLKRQWLEFGKIYLITLGVAFGVMITFYSYFLWPYLSQAPINAFNYRMGFREPLFFFFFFLFISLIASSYFAHLGQKSKAVIDLMIPASVFEKFLTGALFTSLLSIVSFIALFYITDLAFVAKIKATYASMAPQASNSEELVYFFTKNEAWDKFLPLYVVPFLITSVFLLGSIYFNKYHYIKTAISVMVFSGVTSAILYKAGKIIFDGRIFIERGNRSSSSMSQSTAEWLGVLLFAVLVAIFWSITYVRLKEKEV